MKKWIILLVIIVLTGCNSDNDIGNIAVVSTIAIKKEEKEYHTYIKVLSSNQNNDEDIYEETCEFLTQCFEKVNRKLTKRLYLTHLDLLILEKGLEKKDYQEIIQFFLSQKTSRNSFSTIVVDKVNSQLFEYDTKDITNLLDLSIITTGIAKNVSLEQSIREILNYQVSYLPYFENKEDLEVKGYQMIYGENKTLSLSESLAINLIRNDIRKFSLLFDQKIYQLESCNTTHEVKKNKIHLQLSCQYHDSTSKEKEKLEKHLQQLLWQYIKENNDQYFRYLLYQYQGKKVGNIQYEVEVSFDYIESNGGEIFE